MIDFIAAWFPKKPAAYLLLYIVWLITLWFLSERSPEPEKDPQVSHLDKVAHFGYFFGGGGLLAAFLGLRQWRDKPEKSLWVVFAFVVLAGCIVGRLDEYHQSFTPGRDGNDMGDWLADIIGTVFGAWVMLSNVLPRLIPRQIERDEDEDIEIVANSLD